MPGGVMLQAEFWRMTRLRLEGDFADSLWLRLKARMLGKLDGDIARAIERGARLSTEDLEVLRDYICLQLVQEPWPMARTTQEAKERFRKRFEYMIRERHIVLLPGHLPPPAVNQAFNPAVPRSAETMISAAEDPRHDQVQGRISSES